MIHKLEAESIQLEFGSRQILSSIYLKCETGKITGLLGRNGAGKSCLMKIMIIVNCLTCLIYGDVVLRKNLRWNKKLWVVLLPEDDHTSLFPLFWPSGRY
jgi:ABC-type cobalamin/Fe3+-siderophores transport system ATPase subunit